MLRLSEAMRLGAMLRPQTFGYFFKDGRSCAMGAVLEASGMSWPGPSAPLGTYMALPGRFPLLQKMVAHPGGSWKGTVWMIIVDLNNENKWSRERIADWVATLEDPIEAAASEQKDDPVEVMA